MILGGDVRFAKVKVENLMYRIAFIKFKPVVRDNVGALTFEVKYADELTTVASRSGYIPVWYLPWQAGKMVKIKIERFDSADPIFTAGAPGIEALPNPDIFFTAAIAGCSVFARGDVKAPSLYHGGISTDLNTLFTPQQWSDMGSSSENFWRNFLDGVTVVDNRLTRKTGVVKSDGPLGEANRSHYVAERHADGQHMLNQAGQTTTFNAIQFEEFITQDKKRTLDIRQVNPWGAVFGLRDAAGDWAFYLVENATVTYRKITRAKKGLLTKKVYVEEKMPALNPNEKFLSPEEVIRQKPEKVRKADGSPFMLAGPMGAEPMEVNYHYQDQPFSTCVNLGHRRFFPGGGTAQVNLHNEIHFRTT